MIEALVTDDSQILTDPRIIAVTPHLRQLCADGEYQLELQWAKKISNCENCWEGNFLQHHEWNRD